MKVIPWVYGTGKGTGYQLILSGHRQYNVIWEYGADHVKVQWFDKTENHDGWQDLKTVSIPGDYKGKPARDIAHGMGEHMQGVCRALVRDWEGYDVMDTFTQEWAMHTWEEGQKVAYDTAFNGTVLGVVVGVRRAIRDRFIQVRVTSRTNRNYPCGEILEISPTSPWLKTREV
ncbi:hypothetical protein ACIBAH_34795 [Streptomyces sp. NPDC051445]|uniref:hypothetical protein n=1 Tax=Streptomyces sp. NPDC051445 TaxID=3365653 RepID=UPI0037943B3D